jgi:hypothetical protein
MILLKVIDNIGGFHSLLQAEPEKGQRASSLGFVKLSIVQFLLTVAKEEPDICTILIENGFYLWCVLVSMCIYLFYLLVICYLCIHQFYFCFYFTVFLLLID